MCYIRDSNVFRRMFHTYDYFTHGLCNGTFSSTYFIFDSPYCRDRKKRREAFSRDNFITGKRNRYVKNILTRNQVVLLVTFYHINRLNL